jgi:DNA polymerase
MGSARTFDSKPRLSISAADFLPARENIGSLRRAAATCRGCELYKNATQTVFGEGAPHARIVMVGEQPGDVEDRQGHPFIGPAGRLLDKALSEAEIQRQDVYITNAVKHFRWIQRGKRRMHQRPLIRQVMACKPWLRAELDVIRPAVVVCLGASAAQAILGRVIVISRERGKLLRNDSGDMICVTTHPSAILRLREESKREREYRRLLADIRVVTDHIDNRTAKGI